MTDLPDPTTDPTEEETFGFFARLVQNDDIADLIKRTGEQIMANLDALTAAQTATISGLSDLGAQITKLAGQIAALQAGQVTQEQIDAAAATATTIAAGVTAAAAAVDAALEVPGEDDVVTPPEETPVV